MQSRSKFYPREVTRATQVGEFTAGRSQRSTQVAYRGPTRGESITRADVIEIVEEAMKHVVEAISLERGLKVIVCLNHFTLPLVEFTLPPQGGRKQ